MSFVSRSSICPPTLFLHCLTQLLLQLSLSGVIIDIDVTKQPKRIRWSSICIQYLLELAFL